MKAAFQLAPEFRLTPAQLTAADELAESLRTGADFVTLLGVTGSGKTATMATLIERMQQPALVLVHNKTLAGQLYAMLRALLPGTAVEYYVSYYDYFRPEAYVPSTGTYLAKATEANDDIERLRHSATAALFTRSDVVVVATVSAIYPRGHPEAYREGSVFLRRGGQLDRDDLLRGLTDAGYRRSEGAVRRGQVRVRGDTVDVQPSFSASVFRLRLFGDELESIEVVDPTSGASKGAIDHLALFPAADIVAPQDRIPAACEAITRELEERCEQLESAGRMPERERLRARTLEDVRLLRELRWCPGIENYAAYLDGRVAGARPYTLLDYFQQRPLLFVDESHQTLPQLRSMREGDTARKRTLIEHGFRLPSSLDNRPLSIAELFEHVDQVVCLSATPGELELARSALVVEQLVRPTGIVDPSVEVRARDGWFGDLLAEIRVRIERDQRTLVTAVTKAEAEALAARLQAAGVAARWLHADADVVERMQLVRGLRLGEWDVLVGVNLLREGLDLPEVSLVAILDADRSGFLRSQTALIQTIGRTARHAEGQVLMYARSETEAMRAAIAETDRRRRFQTEYNQRHAVVMTTVRSAVPDLISDLALDP